MTARAAQQKLSAQITIFAVATLKDVADEMIVDQRDNTELVRSAAATLMARRPEEDVVAICQTLNAFCQVHELRTVRGSSFPSGWYRPGTEARR